MDWKKVAKELHKVAQDCFIEGRKHDTESLHIVGGVLGHLASALEAGLEEE